VLNPASADAKYGVTPKLTADQVALIIKYGRKDRKRGYVHLQLAQLYGSMDSRTPAKRESILRLRSTVEDNRSRLIEDEADLGRQLGITIKVYAECLTLYRNTGRVSLKWVAKTKDAENAIRWALLAMPNDVRKRDIIENWLAQRTDTVERIRRQIQDERAQALFQTGTGV
jgi:hypothetical protein